MAGVFLSIQNIEARNKRLEAQIAHVNAFRDKDANMLQQADQEGFVLKSQLQGKGSIKGKIQTEIQIFKI